MTDEANFYSFLERLLNAAQLHGIAFAKVRYEIETDSFLLNIIPNEFVTISYEKKDG